MGALLVWSATRQRQIDVGVDPNAFLRKHLINIALGLALGAMTALFDYRSLRAYAPIVYVASILGLIAVLTPGIGKTINGSHSWILLPAGFSVQPSEFAKVALCVALPMLLAERRDAEDEPRLSDVAHRARRRRRTDRADHAAAGPGHDDRHRLHRPRHPRGGEHPDPLDGRR